MSNSYFQKQQSVIDTVKRFEKHVRPFLNDEARAHVKTMLDEDVGVEAEVRLKKSRKSPPAAAQG